MHNGCCCSITQALCRTCRSLVMSSIALLARRCVRKPFATFGRRRTELCRALLTCQVLRRTAVLQIAPIMICSVHACGCLLLQFVQLFAVKLGTAQPCRCMRSLCASTRCGLQASIASLSHTSCRQFLNLQGRKFSNTVSALAAVCAPAQQQSAISNCTIRARNHATYPCRGICAASPIPARQHRDPDRGRRVASRAQRPQQTR